MLEVEDIHTYYGESHILQGVNMKIKEGKCVALLGSNGMGKTTTLRTIMGLTPAKRGTVRFGGNEITAWKSFNIARLGLGYVPEDRGIFSDLTVMENLKVPFLNLQNKSKAQWKKTLDRILALFPELETHLEQLAGSLSGGEQQMVATARALIMGHRMILLDEPTEGLSPIVIQNLVKAIIQIKNMGVTILLVEQNLQTAIHVADHCYILEKGKIKLEESMDIIKKDPEILQQHLGVN